MLTIFHVMLAIANMCGCKNAAVKTVLQTRVKSSGAGQREPRPIPLAAQNLPMSLAIVVATSFAAAIVPGVTQSPTM